MVRSETSLHKETPLVVGGTQTKVLADSMTIAASEVTLS